MTAKVIPFPAASLEGGKAFQFSLSVVRDRTGDIRIATSCKPQMHACEGLRGVLDDLIAMIDNKIDLDAMPSGTRWLVERIDPKDEA